MTKEMTKQFERIETPLGAYLIKVQELEKMDEYIVSREPCLTLVGQYETISGAFASIALDIDARTKQRKQNGEKWKL